jgi:5-methylcytosine-specific restriction endonuclease McrA
MERDVWTCLLCGGPIPPEARWPDPRFGTIDHRVPLSLGGRHVWGNVQAAHLRCNMSKNTKHPDEYDEAAFSHLWP